MTSTIDRHAGAASETGYPSVAARVRDAAARMPDQVAMREKDYGIWREYSRADLWELIEVAAHGLLAFGVEDGDVVSIHSEDRPEWIILDFATVTIRFDQPIQLPKCRSDSEFETQRLRVEAAMGPTLQKPD